MLDELDGLAAREGVERPGELHPGAQGLVGTHHVQKFRNAGHYDRGELLFPSVGRGQAKIAQIVDEVESVVVAQILRLVN